MYLLKDRTGRRKQAPIGFSFTTLFFGPFVPALRGDVKYFLIFFAIQVLANYGVPFLGAFVVNVFLAAMYNEWYLKEMQSKGYRIVN